ncbi:hypothetical protein HLK59_40075 [Streptomyces sp. S3(2020)]|uniref:hypothetical protein n=1 Tax=Streptomyces sp. S3(2020) TaxID=2732044 RepID=UPI0014892D97|nr:hypothetical protein [Streptomyces sp. S3(2020)]NNN36451.1 hypothetical protein [Streptomyces sp. S3(2020)]
MAYDPSDPDTFEDGGGDVELDVEAPEDDAAEQQAEVSQDRDDPLTSVDTDQADEADLIEQARVVRIDEDDYR